MYKESGPLLLHKYIERYLIIGIIIVITEIQVYKALKLWQVFIYTVHIHIIKITNFPKSYVLIRSLASQLQESTDCDNIESQKE